jgi:hypothetical protein
VADFTDALVPSTGTMLRRLAADEDQLTLLQRILDGWPRRQALAVTRDVMTEWSRDEGSAQAIETAVRQQLAEAAAIRGGLARSCSACRSPGTTRGTAPQGWTGRPCCCPLPCRASCSSWRPAP